MNIQSLIDLIAYVGTIFEIPGLVEHRLHGPIERQGIMRNAGWSGWDVEKEIAEKGVRHISGRAFDKDTLTYHVSDRQARWARYILHRAGAPVAGPWTEADLRARAKGQIDGRVPAWNPHTAPRGMWLCKLLDLIADII